MWKNRGGGRINDGGRSDGTLRYIRLHLLSKVSIPVIKTHPTNQLGLHLASLATFTVSVETIHGKEPTYQWQKMRLTSLEPHQTPIPSQVSQSLMKGCTAVL